MEKHLVGMVYIFRGLLHYYHAVTWQWAGSGVTEGAESPTS